MFVRCSCQVITFVTLTNWEVKSCYIVRHLCNWDMIGTSGFDFSSLFFSYFEKYRFKAV